MVNLPWAKMFALSAAASTLKVWAMVVCATTTFSIFDSQLLVGCCSRNQGLHGNPLQPIPESASSKNQLYPQCAVLSTL